MPAPAWSRRFSIGRGTDSRRDRASLILWRISEFRRLDGRGGLVAAGRWHSKGRRIVYLAKSSALAILETLVHLEVATLPPPFQLMKVEAPDALHYEEWPANIDPRDEAETRRWGDGWLDGGRSALAQVPSRIAPAAQNWLLNPLHADAAQVKIAASGRYPWDKRLFRK